METGLQLLMRDGALSVAFQPRLTAEQYAELLDRVNEATTKIELRRELKKLAKKWGSQLEMDSNLAPNIKR
jgi:hypothetical protein